jgi:hypothetical protein
MFNASYLQNSLHSALETIAEESSANATTCGAAPVEYPPNILFYAEYPGGTLTPTLQQWQSLDRVIPTKCCASCNYSSSLGWVRRGSP